MSDMPWQGDACSLVDAFRSGERSPAEELDATLAAIEVSDLNCISHVDAERAHRAAARADVSLPFGGVPAGIKGLEPVTGWPFTEASLLFADRVATYDTHNFERLTGRGGAVPVAQTTVSEFGGLNVSVSKLYGVTHNPWQHGRTVAGSSGGSAAAVAGGLLTLATGSDGGGSIRIPAGYCGVLGMKGTFGRIPRGPHAEISSRTAVMGSLARSVRDAARYYDVCAGPHPADSTSLPDAGPWEAALGTHDLRGRKVAVIPDLGNARLGAGIEDRIRSAAADLIADTGMVPVDVEHDLPLMAALWMMDGMSSLLAELGDRWPSCAGDMTDEIAIALRLSETFYNLRTAAAIEEGYVRANDAMAALFEQADLVIAATNPDVAFPAEATMAAPPNRVLDAALANRGFIAAARAAMFAVRVAGAAAPSVPVEILEAGSRLLPDVMRMGTLTMISNLYGNPAVSIPVGTIDGLPVGMQVLARHHADALLFDVALAVERERPWPLVAPGAR